MLFMRLNTTKRAEQSKTIYEVMDIMVDYFGREPDLINGTFPEHYKPKSNLNSFVYEDEKIRVVLVIGAEFQVFVDFDYNEKLDSNEQTPDYNYNEPLSFGVDQTMSFEDLLQAKNKLDAMGLDSDRLVYRVLYFDKSSRSLEETE